MAHGESLTIGRDVGVDVHVADARVSRRHTVVEPVPGGWRLVDYSRNGVFVDSVRVSSYLIMGPVVAMLADPKTGVAICLALARPPSEVDQRREGPTGGPPTYGKRSGVHHLRRDRWRIERLPENDLVLDDLLVSRRHAELHRGSDGWQLTDLNSPNGTYVNGERVTQARVNEGDIIGMETHCYIWSATSWWSSRTPCEVEFRARIQPPYPTGDGCSTASRSRCPGVACSVCSAPAALASQRFSGP